MISDFAFTIALAAGWMSLVVALVWPTPHCRCCPERVAKAKQERPDSIRR